MLYKWAWGGTYIETLTMNSIHRLSLAVVMKDKKCTYGYSLSSWKQRSLCLSVDTKYLSRATSTVKGSAWFSEVSSAKGY